MKDRSDFERVLMNIAIDTAGSIHDKMKQIKNGWTLRFRFDNPAPQFIPTIMAENIGMPLKKGDIVKCVTNPNHHWGISVFIEQRGYSDWLLQEIGGDKLLNMNNESLEVLRFMNPSHLYTGKKYQVYKWGYKAFLERYNKNTDYFKRCGGIEFNEDNLTIWSRPHIWVMERSKDGITLYAQPKKFTMKWKDKTRLKDIVNSMNEQGFGEEFEYTPEKPTEGQTGYTSFTKSDVEKILKDY